MQSKFHKPRLLFAPGFTTPHAIDGHTVFPEAVSRVWGAVRRWIAISVSAMFAGLGAAHARSWTNTDGKVIEADYVSHDESHVVLETGGREVRYPVEKLSPGDQAYLAAMEPVAAEVFTGHRKDLAIAHRLFSEPDDYYKDRDRRSVFKAFEGGAFSDSGEAHKTGGARDWIKRDPALDTYDIYVPASCGDNEPCGLFVYIQPGDSSRIPEKWFPVFDAFRLIAVSPANAGNKRPMLRRTQVAMDALATVEKQFKIDPARRVVSGLSGGGHMAMLTAAMYPDFFVGAVSHAAQSYLPLADGYGSGHFPGLALGDFTGQKRRHLKWVVISGDKDYNYKEILSTSEKWAAAKLGYRFLDVPGMGHDSSAAGPLREALLWIGLTERL